MFKSCIWMSKSFILITSHSIFRRGTSNMFFKELAKRIGITKVEVGSNICY